MADDMINPPAPADVLPTSPAPNLLAATPAVAVPAAQPTQPQAPSTQPHPLARAFDAVLKAATGGDAYYIDPETGERKIAPQSRGTLGRTLIAATLAGMLAPDKYRETPYGPVRDWNGTAGNAMAASQATLQAARNKPQEYSDEQQAAKLRVLENNSRALALHTAQWQFKQNQYAVNKPTIDATNQALEDYQNNRDKPNDPSQPDAWLARGVSAEDVLASGHNLTDANVYQDGQTPNGEPTYAIINPALRNITLSKAQTDLLSQYNSQYKNIHAVVGGKVTVPMSTFISGMHDLAMINSMVTSTDQDPTGGWLNQLSHADDVNGSKAKEITPDQFKAAVRDNPKMLKALWALTHAGASGTLPDQRPDALLRGLAQTPGGDGVLKLMGLTPQDALNKADDINRKRESAEALAKMGGIGPKAPASPESLQSTKDTITNDKTLSAEQKGFLLQRFPAPGPDGQVHMTQGQLKDIEQSYQSLLTTNERDSLSKGDPQAIQDVVNGVVFGGDPTKMSDLFTYARGNPTLKAQVASQLRQTAVNAGLDPNNYTFAAQENKAAKQAEFTGGMKTKTGQQLIAFNTLMGHLQDAYSANDAWVRSNNPALARTQSWWAKNASNDKDYLRFQDDIIAPAKEYMNFLNQNRAEHEEDISALKKVIDPSVSPRAATEALNSFLRTADVRAAALADDYTRVMGHTYPVVSAEGQSLLNKVLGGKSKSVAASQPIPRGWVNGNQRSQPTPAVLQTIYNAAHGDKVLATRLANENGWVIPR